MLSEVYIDESYDDQEPPLLCVGGYLYRKQDAREFSRKWATYLERKGLPYFHMSECAHRGGVFAGRDDCDEIARELIRRTRSSTRFGFAIAVNERDYSEERGETKFIFEDGHRHRADAHAFLDFMLKSESLAREVGYAGHAFMPKVTPAIHPADNLCWHWRLEAKRRYQANRRRPRGDFLALVRPTDLLADYQRLRLERFNADMKRRTLETEAMMRIAVETGVAPPPVN